MQKIFVFPVREWRVFFCGVLACLFIACHDSTEEPPEPADRTVLIYMAADNSLSSHASKNLQQILAGASGNSLNGGNLLVYIDARNAAPVLVRVVPEGGGRMAADTVRVYDEQNSASQRVLRGVIDEVVSRYPAQSYGLGLWSHGSAWMPTDTEIRMRSFGDDNGSVLDLNDLRDALPDRVFDFIFFDACYMGSVEVAYALKDKADYVLASPTEVIGSGFPYETIIPFFFKATPELERAAAAFFDYYDAQSGLYRTATVSLVATAGLPALADFVRTALKSHADWRTEQPSLLDDVQPCDYLYSRRVLYDLKDFIVRLAPETEAAFGPVFAGAVPYARSTATCYFARPGVMKPTADVHGLSMFVMGCYPALDDWYKQLDWYRAVYE